MLSAKQIQPGQAGQIEVRVDTEGITSRLTKTVTVTTRNDPRQPLVTLTLMGTARAEFTLSDKRIAFGSVPQGKEVSREIVITVASSRPLKLLSVVSSTDGNVRVRLEPIPNSGGQELQADHGPKAGWETGRSFRNHRGKNVQYLQARAQNTCQRNHRPEQLTIDD